LPKEEEEEEDRTEEEKKKNTFIHSFIQEGTPSRNLFRGAPIPTTTIQISLK